MVECFMCGAKFEPRPDKLKEWAESGRDFDPTDWECKTCYSLTPLALDGGDSAARQAVSSPDVVTGSEADSIPPAAQ